MSSYICQSDVKGSISLNKEKRLIKEADDDGREWYYDLGDVAGVYQPVNMLIIEDTNEHNIA